jgi:hypothetical protein
LRDRVDAALVVGGDVNLDKRRFVNADIKYITPLESDLSAGGTKAGRCQASVCSARPSRCASDCRASMASRSVRSKLKNAWSSVTPSSASLTPGIGAVLDSPRGPKNFDWLDMSHRTTSELLPGDGLTKN